MGRLSTYTAPVEEIHLEPGLNSEGEYRAQLLEELSSVWILDNLSTEFLDGLYSKVLKSMKKEKEC